MKGSAGSSIAPPARGLLAALPLLAALAFFPGCDSRTATGSLEAPDLDELPRLAHEEVARIGSWDDPDYGFSRIGGSVDVDRDGNVYVPELQDMEIRVYSADGELLRRIGRPGEGPGEFSGFGLDFGVHGDTVWTFDRGAQRLTLFARTGEVLSTANVEDVRAPLHLSDQTTMIWPAAMDEDGLLVGDRGMTMGMTGEPVRDTALIPRIRFDTDGQIVDTVGSYPVWRFQGGEIVSVGGSRHSLPLPPSAEPRLIRTAEGLVWIDQHIPDHEAALRVTRMDHAGDTIWSRVFAYRAKPFPEALLDSIATDRGHQTGSLILATGSGIERLERRPEDTAAARAAIRRQMNFPERQPPVQAHRVTAEGGLWLRREDMGGDTYRWTVIDPEGEPVGELELPRALRVVWASSDAFWAVESDEMGVPWLLRFRITSEGSAR